MMAQARLILGVGSGSTAGTWSFRFVSTPQQSSPSPSPFQFQFQFPLIDAPRRLPTSDSSCAESPPCGSIQVFRGLLELQHSALTYGEVHTKSIDDVRWLKVRKSSYDTLFTDKDNDIGFPGCDVPRDNQYLSLNSAIT